MIIDIVTHVMLPKYKERIYKYSSKFPAMKAVQEKRLCLTDYETRVEKLAKHGNIVQVINTTMPPIEEVVGPEEAVDLARLCNDEMAELVSKYPKYFIAAVANLPLNDIDASLKEAERAIKQLGFKGIQIYSRVNDNPPSVDYMMPIYELMAEYDLPIWIHPARVVDQADFLNEDISYYQLFSIYGWPYDTTAAMARLVFSGVLEKFPNIKFITHHLGGMAPYYSDRAIVHWNNGLQRLGAEHFPGLTKHPVEYLKMFYADTATNGNSNHSMECGLAFFGEDRVLFGTDSPYDLEDGDINVRTTIDGIEKMGLATSIKEKIYEKNARRILHL